MPRFYVPRRIVFGKGSARHMASFVHGKTMLITGRRTWAAIEDYVNEYVRNYTLHIYERSTPTGEPSEADVERLAAAMRETEPETLLAIGGGSVIDSVKAAWVFYEHPEITWKEVYAGKIPPLRSKARLVAVETTSGTGTGISPAGVVTGRDHVKRGVAHEELIPDAAVYDVNFTVSMSRETAIYSGMDALTHALEAHTSRIDNPPADTLAAEAVKIVLESIESSAEGDEEARERMHTANMMAAMAFSNARLGICHAVAHQIGGRFNVPHGLINGVLLPYSVLFNREATEKYDALERYLGLEKGTLHSVLLNLNEALGIPTDLQFLGEKLMEMLPTIAEGSAASSLMKVNPRQAGAKEIEDFLRMAWDGIR